MRKTVQWVADRAAVQRQRNTIIERILERRTLEPGKTLWPKAALMALTRVLWSRSGPPMQRLLIRSTSTQVEVSFRCLTCLHHWQGARCNFGHSTLPRAWTWFISAKVLHSTGIWQWDLGSKLASWLHRSHAKFRLKVHVPRAKALVPGAWSPFLILRISLESLQFAQKWERETPQIGEVQHLISVEKMINGHEQMKSDKVCTWIWC
jgi:hypothetical protein